MENVMVIGAGFMGAGIAQVCAQSGYRVYLVDRSETALQNARREISRSLQKFFSKGHLAEHPPVISGRISCDRSIRAAAGMQWVLEAVVEDETTKRDLFKEIDGRCRGDIPLATNTSSIPISRLAEGLRHPERVLGLHFFGPVPLMPVVEVVRGERTAPEVFEKGTAFVESLGKKPIGVTRDLPGFVLNRVFAAALRECLDLVAAGTASVDDIDAGMRLGYGWKAGPFEIADNAGIDTVLNVSRSLRSLGEGRLVSEAGTAILEKMAAGGQLGRKTGRGFYRYDAEGKKR